MWQQFVGLSKVIMHCYPKEALLRLYSAVNYTHQKVLQHFSLLNNEEQAFIYLFIGMVTTSQILRVYTSNMTQWIINIHQIKIYNVTHYVL